jgi:hypothetical protein
MTIRIMIEMIRVATLIETRRFATESFLENLLGPHTREQIRYRVTDAMVANDARKLGRLIYPIGELRRDQLLKLLSTPEYLARVAAKEKRHAELYARLSHSEGV